MNESNEVSQFVIRKRFTNEVLFTYDLQEGQESGMIARHALETAIAEDANLRGANLRGANLRGANLRGADLRGANLRGANLRDADLLGADLLGADLYGADLYGADLLGADLYGADLYGAKNAPLIIYGKRWVIIIDGLGNLRIGCQMHSIERWESFSDALIARMDSNALEFWNENKVALLAFAKAHKHEVTA